MKEDAGATAVQATGRSVGTSLDSFFKQSIAVPAALRMVN